MKHSPSPPLKNCLSDPDSRLTPENYLPDHDLPRPPKNSLSDPDSPSPLKILFSDLDSPQENYIPDIPSSFPDFPSTLEYSPLDLDSLPVLDSPQENYLSVLSSPKYLSYDIPSPKYLSDIDLIMKHSPSPPVKKELSELEPFLNHSLSSCNTMKRKSPSESNDETRKKQKKQEKMISGESSRSLCGICFDSKTDSDMFKRKSCNHLFCVDCISKYVDSQINNNVVKVICPNPNCYVKLKPKHLENIMSREFIDRWESSKYESKIALEQKIYCPFESCSILLVNDNSGGEVVVTSCECPYCHRLFCAQCKVPWHAEMSCEEFQNLKVEKHEQDLDDKFLKLAEKEKWQKCPNCSFYVKRSHGCEHMKCRCNCNFCYHCGKKWKIGHLCNGVYS